jgi:phage gpG-like protein
VATLTLQDVRKAARGITTQGMTEAAFVAALPALKIIAVAGVKDHFRNKAAPDGTAWKPLKRARIDGSSNVLEDTGRLKNSVQARGTTDLTLFSSHPAANLHQYGGRVVPRTAHMLALPLTREAKRVGSPRQNGFPRPLFVYVSRRGHAFLAEPTPLGLVLQYLLKRYVDVPARPFVGFSPATLRKMERVLADRQSAYLSRIVNPTAVRRL